MSRRSLFLALSMLAVLLLCSCGPHWVVVRQATPNPLSHATKFVIEPVHYETLVIGSKSDAEYTAGKDDAQRASWMDDKAGASREFTDALQNEGGFQFGGMPPADAQTFVVRATVTYWEPGFYAVAAASNSEMRMNVQILGPQGVIDEINVSQSIGASMYNPSTGGRMRSAAKHIGRVVNEYLRKRTV